MANLAEQYKKQSEDAVEAQRKALAAGSEPESWGHALGDIGVGLVQGAILNPIEGAAELAELAHIPGAQSVAGMLPGMRERAGSTGYGQVAEFAGSILPYLAQPEIGIGRGIATLGPKIAPKVQSIWNVISRSTLPSVLQPVGADNPDLGTAKLVQAGLGTMAGEALHYIGTAARNWLTRRAAEKAQREGALATHQQQVLGVLDKNEAIDAHNQRIREHVDRTNQQNERRYQADRVAADAKRFRQAGVPVQATREMYGQIYGLVGEAPPSAINWRTPAATLRMVGDKLNGIYQQMSIEGGVASPLLGDFGQRAVDVRNALTGLPVRFQRQWTDAYRQYVVEPLITAGNTMTGDALVRYTSTLRSKINEFGLLAQKGKFGPAYRNMARGLDEMLEAIEQHADARNPGLGEARQRANQAYHMADVMTRTSRPVDDGIVTPKAMAEGWQTKVGRRSFGSATSPYTTVRQRLIDLHREHTAPIDQPTAPVKLKGPQPVPRQEPPNVPVVVAPGQSSPNTAADYAARIAAHALRAKTGIPVHVSNLALSQMARHATKAAPVVAPLRHGAGAASVVTGQAVSGLWNITDDRGNWRGMTRDPGNLQPGERLGSPVQER